MWRGWGYIILVIVLAVLFNLNHFFELTYGTNATYGTYIALTALKMDPIYNNLSIGLNIMAGDYQLIENDDPD